MGANIGQIKENARKFKQKKQWDKAIKEYEKALQLGDTDPITRNELGDCYTEKGDNHKAYEMYSEAMDYYVKNSLYKNAIALGKKVLRKNPNKAEIYKMLGEFYAADNMPTDAIKHFLDYVDRKRQSNDIEAISEAYRKIVDLDPTNASIRAELASLYVMQGKKDEAVKMYIMARKNYQEQGKMDKVSDIEAELDKVDMNWRELSKEVSVEKGWKKDDTASSYSFLAELGLVPLEEETTKHETPVKEAKPAETKTEGIPLEVKIDLPGDTKVVEKQPEKTIQSEKIESSNELSLDLSTVGVDVKSAKISEVKTELVPDKDIDLPVPSEGVKLDLDLDVETKAPDLSGETSLGKLDEIETAPITGPLTVGKLRAMLIDNPSNWEAHEKLGNLLQEKGQIQEAVEHYKKSADGYAEKENYQKSIALYKRISDLIPNDAKFHMEYVELARASKNKTEIIEALIRLGASLTNIGELEKAKSVYQRILESDPHNARAKQRLELLEKSSAPAEVEIKQPKAESKSGYVSLSSLLEEDEEETEKEKSQMVLTGTGEGAPPVMGLDTIIETFKSAVSQNIEVEDFRAHYDLGVAYKEMGLLDEAIGEFQIASRGEKERLRSYEMLGICFMEKGNINFAIKQFQRGLETKANDDIEYLGCRYNLALAYEQLGELEKAKEQYEEIILVQIDFRDVKERLAAVEEMLKQGPQKSAKKPLAPGSFTIDDEEADKLFDF